MGRLNVKPNSMITMRDLLAAGLISQIRDGVKLLAKVCNYLFTYYSDFSISINLSEYYYWGSIVLAFFSLIISPCFQ